jgi:arylsulfatase A
VPEKYFKKYNSMGNDSLLSSVYGMVENMDQNIGLILKKLEELKLRENTIVIFLSDNGPNTDRYNGNMKGRKGSVDEGGIRVPFYISWPYKIKPGVSPQIAQGIDLLPTLVSVCSLKYEAAVPWDGIDLSNQVLHGANPFDRYIFSRQAAWPLSKCNGSVRDMQYRLVVSGKDTLLYDMISDPAQKKNISGEKPEIRKKLAVAFLNWQNEMVSNYKLQTTIKAGFNEEKFIFLPVQDAQLSGKVKYSSIHPNQSYTENWVQSGDSIIWNLNMHQSGTYRVNVQYGCKKTETGSRFLLATKQGKTEFTIFKPFESIILPNRDYVTRKESVERTWGWMSAGMISLGAGNEQIKLKLIKNSGNEA